MERDFKGRLRHYILRRHHNLHELLGDYPAMVWDHSPILIRLSELQALHQAFFPTETLPLTPGVEERSSLDTPIETTFTEVKP